MSKKEILSVYNVSKSFNKKVLNNISFKLFSGQTLGIVGESGSGKTTLARIIVKFYDKYYGDIFFENKNIKDLSNKELSKSIQMVFQSAISALNPALTIRNILMDNLILYKICDRKEWIKKIEEVLHLVLMDTSCLDKFPHQLSGGELQRIGIARALLVNAKIIILDEITSALDVNTQLEILNILKDIQKKLNVSYIFISHDLSVLHYIADNIMIIKNGNVVEINNTYEIFNNPQDKYTKKIIEIYKI